MNQGTVIYFSFTFDVVQIAFIIIQIVRVLRPKEH